MTIQSHDHIEQPGEDEEIWRYYSTSQFIRVLQTKALYLSRLDELKDPFEGYGPVRNLETELEQRREYADKAGEELEEIHNLTPEENVTSRYELSRRLSLVNCWTMREDESLPMWNSYIPEGDGVAIGSTIKNLQNAIDKASDVDYYLGKIEYFDYFDDFLSTNNQFSFIMSKPSQYEFEQEVRLFFWWPNKEDERYKMENLDPGDSVPLSAAPTGIPLDIQLDSLIDSVVISPFGPPWSTPEFWSDILSKYDIQISPEESKLAMKPSTILSNGESER